jgi:hypothetical protein
MATRTGTPRSYPGAYLTPSAELLQGAIGWRHTKRHTPGQSQRTGFEIVYPDGIEQFDLDGNRLRSSAIWGPQPAEREQATVSDTL